MGFVLRMVVRETRASWARLAFFFICVAIGVAAIVALRSVIQNVRATLGREARALMTADVVVQTNRPWTPEMLQRIEGHAARRATERTDLIELTTMVRPADTSKAVARMVELQAVQSAFPLYGQITLTDARPYSHALLEDHGALVRPELLAQLEVTVGDRLVIGSQSFEIRGVLGNEPGRRLGLFSFGSRVLIDHKDLPSTGLLAFGARASYRQLFRVSDDNLQPFVSELRGDFSSEFVSVRSYRGREDQIGEDLERTENYLSLVGFVVILLGGIGVWSVTRVFVHQKLKAIAVLKCIGASTGQIIAVYIAQMVTLALAGSILGVVLAWVGLTLVPAQTWQALPGVPQALTLSAIAQGIGVGLLVSVLFALVPLLQIRQVKPLLLLRDESSMSGAGMGDPRGWWRRARQLAVADWTRTVSSVAVGAALVGLAIWQAGSLRVGLLVTVGFLVVAFVLHLAGLALVRAVRPLAMSRWFPLRHAVISVSRPGNQTRVILLAVGIGSFFIIGVQLLQSSLLAELSVQLREDAPDMFLLDIQQDQVARVGAFLQERVPASETRLIPVLRARVTGVRGKDINLENFEDVRSRGSLAREYTVTYRAQLETNERVVDGTFWDPSPSSEPEVSIEEGLHERYSIGVGDVVRFDILGRIIEARVTSIREVEWGDSRNGGFMFLFRPGVLDVAPHTYVGLLQGPDDATARATLQRDLVVEFPNVSAVDVREVAKTIQGVVSSVTLAITVVGATALFSGVLILVGSVAMTKFQRLYESALFKTLGAPTRTIATMVVLEYGTLGTLAGLVGSVGGLVLSWVVSRQVLDIPWRPFPVINLAGILLTALLVGTVGLAASVDVLRRKPLSILRAE